MLGLDSLDTASSLMCSNVFTKISPCYKGQTSQRSVANPGVPGRSAEVTASPAFGCARERQEFVRGPSEAQREERCLCRSPRSHVARLNLRCLRGTKVWFARRAVTKRSSRHTCTELGVVRKRTELLRREDTTTSPAPCPDESSAGGRAGGAAQVCPLPPHRHHSVQDFPLSFPWPVEASRHLCGRTSGSESRLCENRG